MTEKGFQVLYRESVAKGLGLGRGFLGRDMIFFVAMEDHQD